MHSSPDPLGERLRSLRLARRLSYQQLALRAGIASRAFVFHVENGTKRPSEQVAVRLARALGEDEQLFAAWARLRSGGDLGTMLAAARRVLVDPEVAAFAAGRWAPASAARAEVSGTPRLRIPLLSAGDDPGDDRHPACEVLDVLRLGEGALGEPEVLVRPFAYVLTAPLLARVPDLGRAGHLAVLTRARAPLDVHRVFAVRHGGGIELARVLWNGRELLMLPAPERSDFVVLEAEGEAGLQSLIAGSVARVLDASRLADTVRDAS